MVVPVQHQVVVAGVAAAQDLDHARREATEALLHILLSDDRTLGLPPGLGQDHATAIRSEPAIHRLDIWLWVQKIPAPIHAKMMLNQTCWLSS